MSCRCALCRRRLTKLQDKEFPEDKFITDFFTYITDLKNIGREQTLNAFHCAFLWSIACMIPEF